MNTYLWILGGLAVILPLIFFVIVPAVKKNRREVEEMRRQRDERRRRAMTSTYGSISAARALAEASRRIPTISTPIARAPELDRFGGELDGEGSIHISDGDRLHLTNSLHEPTRVNLGNITAAGLDELYLSGSWNRRNEPASRSRIMGYHGTKGNMEDLSQGHRFRVGYEIEKNVFISRRGRTSAHRGDNVGSYRAFRGFETDSSCGVEAITHVLPLSSSGTLYGDVVNMFEEARNVIDSPSDRRCGGHINISVDGIDSSGELIERVRDNFSLLLAVFRKRLNNSFCSGNKTMRRDNFGAGRSMLAKKGNGLLEFRLPPQVKNVEQLLRRHRLLAIVMEHSFSDDSDNFDMLIEKTREVMLDMYNGNEDKYNTTIDIAKKMRNHIQGDEPHNDIREWFREEEGLGFTGNSRFYASPNTIASLDRAIQSISEIPWEDERRIRNPYQSVHPSWLTSTSPSTMNIYRATANITNNEANNNVVRIHVELGGDRRPIGTVSTQIGSNTQTTIWSSNIMNLNHYLGSNEPIPSHITLHFMDWDENLRLRVVDTREPTNT